jgi:hypothetical protein
MGCDGEGGEGGKITDLHLETQHFISQMLVKKTKKHCSVAERSFAVGALADCMEPLQVPIVIIYSGSETDLSVPEP